MRRYVTVLDVVARYGGAWSQWQIYERCGRNLIPHRKHPGSNRILFDPNDLDAFDDGATELECIVLRPPARGLTPGKLVRPKKDVSRVR